MHRAKLTLNIGLEPGLKDNAAGGVFVHVPDVYVFDSYALLALFEDQKESAGKVLDSFFDHFGNCFLIVFHNGIIV